MLHDQDPIQISHFLPHDHTAEHGGFRTVLWEVPRDPRELMAAIFFTHNLNLSRYCFVVGWLFVFLYGLLLFVFAFGVVFAFVFGFWLLFSGNVTRE